MAHYIFFENETYLTSVLSCRGFLKIKCQTQEESDTQIKKWRKNIDWSFVLPGIYTRPDCKSIRYSVRNSKNKIKRCFDTIKNNVDINEC